MVWVRTKYLWVHCGCMSAEVTHSRAESDSEYTPQYGDTFKHIITGDEKTVHDVRDGEVTWVNGGWDAVDDLQAAVNGNGSLYEPVSVADGAWEGDGY